MSRILRRALLSFGCAWYMASGGGLAFADPVELVMDVRVTGLVRRQMAESKSLSWVARWEVTAPLGQVTDLVSPGAREVDGHSELIVGVAGNKIYNGKFKIYGYSSEGAAGRGELVATLVVQGSKITPPGSSEGAVSWLSVQAGSSAQKSVGAGRLQSYAEIRLVRTVGATCEVAYPAPGSNLRRAPIVETQVVAELGPQRVKTTPDGERVPSLLRAITVRAAENAPVGLRLRVQVRTPKAEPWVTLDICVEVVNSTDGPVELVMDVRKTGQVRHQMEENKSLSWVSRWKVTAPLGQVTDLVKPGAREVDGHWELIVGVAGSEIYNGQFKIFGYPSDGATRRAELVATLVVEGSRIEPPK